MSAERRLARIERRLLQSRDVAAWRRGIARLRQALALGDEDAARLIVQALAAPPIVAALAPAARAAFRAGAEDGVRIASAAGRPVASAAVVAGAAGGVAALGAAGALDERGGQAVTAARRLVLGGADSRTFAAPLLGHARRVDGTVADLITQAAAAGETEAARQAGLPIVWVAEVNACVHCLAYSGRVVEPGEDFPPNLTFGASTPHGSPGQSPPLHPRCRCELEPLRSDEYAAALRREAERSVLRGFSLESESMAVRVDAARRLLERGVDAPKSVVDFARRRVKAGNFPTRGRPE